MIYKVLAYCEAKKEWVAIRECKTQDEAVGYADYYHLATGADTLVETEDGGKH